MIRVLVADDHPIVRSGIVGLLAAAEGIEVVGEAADGREAVDRAAALSPDVVLMDLRMPNLDGVAATAQILAATPGIRVLILTTYETDDQILGAIEAGASGYLLKAAPQAEIIEGVRSVAGGQHQRVVIRGTQVHGQEQQNARPQRNHHTNPFQPP